MIKKTSCFFHSSNIFFFAACAPQPNNCSPGPQGPSGIPGFPGSKFIH